MLIEVWSDIVCPWCYVGLARFEKVLDGFEHRDDVQVRHRAFELDPGLLPGRVTSVIDMLQQKMGGSREQVLEMEQRMAGLAAAEGLAYTADRPTGNSAQAHEVLLLAADRGSGDVARHALWKAHFGEGRSVFTPEDLTPIATDAGLDVAEVQQVLATDTYLDQVRADEDRAGTLGITGVPFFVFGDVAKGSAIGISGAQPAETFASALQRGWAEQAASPA